MTSLKLTNITNFVNRSHDIHKLKASHVRKSAAPTSPIERYVTEQFGYPVKLMLNKNETGCFRIHFHDRAHMQKILERLGCASEELPTD